MKYANRSELLTYLSHSHIALIHARMKIGLQTWGTDGDFFPFLALAIGLKDAGHEVMLVYTNVDGKDYAHRPEAEGIELINAHVGIAIPTGINPYALASKPGSFKEYSKLLEFYFDPFTEAMYQASVELCQKCDLVIGHAVCHTLLTTSQKLNVPRVSLVLTPLVVRSKYVSPIGINLGTTLNSTLWSIGGFVATRIWFKEAKKLRAKEGLRPISSLQKELFTSDLLTVVAASTALVERPKDWPSNIQMTGFLNLRSSENWHIPEDLKTFLEAGEAPIYLTFGSCMQFDLEASTRLLVETARLSGKRAIVQSDWSKVAKPTDSNIYCIERAPHSVIFPHCSAIVHHGGAGTTQAALLAGKPSIVVAHGFDQPYWGKQLEKAEVGKAVKRKSVTSEHLASEINSILSSKNAADNAQRLGKKMMNENGVQAAIRQLQHLLNQETGNKKTLTQ